MPEATDESIAQVMLALMRARRALHLDTQTFDDLVGSILVEIDLGMQVAEEASIEARYRRAVEGTIVAFPAARVRQPQGRGAEPDPHVPF